MALSSIVSPENEKALSNDRQQNQAEGPVPIRAGDPRPLPGSGGLFGHAAAKHRRPRMYCQQLQHIKADGHHRSGHQGNLPQNRFLAGCRETERRDAFLEPLPRRDGRHAPLTVHGLPGSTSKLMRSVHHPLSGCLWVRLGHQVRHHHIPVIAIEVTLDLRVGALAIPASDVQYPC